MVGCSDNIICTDPSTNDQWVLRRKLIAMSGLPASAFSFDCYCLHAVCWALLCTPFFAVDDSFYKTICSLNEVTLDGKEHKISDHTMLLQTSRKLKPVHFLIFSTGASSVPRCGWPVKPQIVFDHSASCSLISSSTCALKTTIPITSSSENMESFFPLCHEHGARCYIYWPLMCDR
jgi:hypothetical protein